MRHGSGIYFFWLDDVESLDWRWFCEFRRRIFFLCERAGGLT
jgi:hypothetical protein